MPQIVHADILSWAATYAGPKFHAILCDPPYHLTETTKRFGGQGASPAQYGSDGAFQRASRGFMGRTWDGGDIAYRPETWAALAQHLHPGAFLFAFAGTRGYHRMACAIEDAGFIIHPAIGWAFGSGFPKATRIDTQIDRRAGVERTKVGTKKHQPKFAAKDFGYREKDNGYNSRERESFDVTAPATELAQAWAGHRYGGQVLKPAFEFICVAQWPYQGKPVECITTTGAGALHIDGGRVGTGGDKGWDEEGARLGAETTAGIYGAGEARAMVDQSSGRWPANLVLSHSAACNGACMPDCPVGRLGEQSGESEATRSIRVDRNTKPGYEGGWQPLAIERGHDDVGTAARYFYQADWMLEQLEQADSVIYVAKANQSEREAGLDPRQVALLDKDAIAERADAEVGALRDGGRGGRIVGRRFAQDTINAGRETPIDNPYQRGETTRRNIHPTIKPISLARHLASLLLPPDAYAPRRLLIPFCGAGSEVVGAMFAGWEEITGIELEADHVAIAEARIAYWQQRMHEFGDPSKSIRAELRAAPVGQLDMFDDEVAA